MTVLVKVQLFEDRRIESFVPKNNMNVKLLSLLDDANRTNHITGQNSDIANAADVTFSVEDETIQAHSLILKMVSADTECAYSFFLCNISTTCL